MKISIIGAGWVGGNLGKMWAKHGHEVMFGSRDPHSGKIKTLLAEAGPNASAGTVSDAMAFSDVIAVALPGHNAPEILRSAGDWQGKILIDATNRFGGGSVAHDIAQATGARVVKAFNTIGAENLLNPVFDGIPASMFLCGDDAQAREIVSGLAADLGFEPVDVGPLSMAPHLEALASVWVGFVRSGVGREMGFKLLRR